MTELFLISITLFLSTNLDDLVILTAFFASGYKTRNIVIGQLIGIGLLTTFSMAVAGGYDSLGIHREYVGLCGFIPIFIGLKSIFYQKRDLQHSNEGEQTKRSNGRVQRLVVILGQTGLIVTTTVGNGSDNIGVYIPVFATFQYWWQFAAVSGLFLLLTLAWCYISYHLVFHASKWMGALWVKEKIKSMLPFILIALGLYVLWENETLNLLRMYIHLS